MNRVLVVDDDPVVLRIYQDGLVQRGFSVDTAWDGLAAMKSLSSRRPDLVVLDLMMPKLSGVDVLKYIRSQPELQGLKVVVLSNSYANEIAAEATALGVERALLKVRCTPAKLCTVIDDVLAGRATAPDAVELLAAGQARLPAATAPTVVTPPAPAIPAQPPQATPAPPAPTAKSFPAPAPAETKPPMSEEEALKKTRADFLKLGPDVCKAVRNLFEAFLASKTEAERSLRLQNFYRKIHFITATSGLANCEEIAHLATVFEATLFDLMTKPGPPQASMSRTLTQAVEMVEVLYERGPEGRTPKSSHAQVLVVDDDAVCNRLVVNALRVAHLQARSTEDPRVGLEYLKQNPFDMVLLDIEMPGLNGFEVCRQLRQIPGHEKTPVIFVTSHDDFVNREESAAAGGGDLIGKPILPLELALKVVMHLIGWA